MLAIFILAALAYTAIEIAFWYSQWWNALNKEPMPIVKSLLFAVFYAHAMLVINLLYHIVTGADIFRNPIFTGLLLLGAISHLLPIWRQNIHKKSNPCAYLLRLVVFSTAITGATYAF